MRTTALVFVAAIAAQPLRAQPAPPNPPEGAPSATPAPPRPGVRVPNQPGSGAQAPARAQPVAPPATNRPAIAPNRTITPQRPPQTRPTEPTPVEPIDSKEAARRSTGVMMNFDRRDLVEVIQFVSNYTGRNFILPERVSGKITILSNRSIPPDEVWNVFVAALDANNWAVYPIGHYWKLSEKKQSARANIPTYLEPGQEAPPIEQMVTKLFSIVPDSLYSKIGIQNGDVIRRINGYEMNSPDKALEIYQKLRDANRIEIELERRGDTLRKSYSIE